MSEKILIDVDERINSIKNSLKEIGSNLVVTPSREDSKLSSKSRQKSSGRSSPKSSKKSSKVTYVSKYIALGNTEDSDSSSEEVISPRKVTFDPTATEIFSKNLEFKGETITKDSYFQDINDLQHQLTQSKDRNSHLESILSQKEQEIINLVTSQEVLKKHLDLKTKNLEDSEKIIESLKSEVLNLNSIIAKYQTALCEFESFHKDYESRKDERNKDLESCQQKVFFLQQEIKELNQRLVNKESEVQSLQLTNRELERENNHFGKFIKKNKDKKSPTEKKLKDEIKNLRQINENLREEIKKKPNDLVLKETEKKLNDLEKIVADHCGKKNSGNDKKIIGSLMVLLKVQKSSEIYSKVAEISKIVAGQKFELSKKLRNLIVKYSPPGSFQKLPNDRKIVSWIKRLIEEYLMKVKQDEFNSKNLEGLRQCMRIMEVTFPEDLVRKVEELKIKSL
jgi:predicted  nucleic acid-binding Zn-ribbon protein